MLYPFTMKNEALWHQNVVVGPFQCNCRILVCPLTAQAAVIDPGDEAPRILKALEKFQTPSGKPIQVRYLLHTHAHLDHIGATRNLKQTLETQGASHAAKIVLHPGDEPIYEQLPLQGEMFGMHYDAPLPIELRMEDEQIFEIGKMKLSVIHTPGHSPGSVCLRLHESSESGNSEMLFSGDTLFQGSVGRTDLWGGDMDTEVRSIKKRLLTLDGGLRVCPGHGPDTTIDSERRNNPYVS